MSGVPIEVVANVLDCDVVVSEFDLQLFICSHLINTLEKGKTLLFFQPWVKSTTIVLL